MEVAIYARVSTENQQQAQTIQQQIDRLQERVAQDANWHLAESHIFQDDGYSGARLNRPGLDALRDQAALAEFEWVLITAPDRLARNLTHQAVILDELQRRGCGVEFLDHPMSDDPHDRLLLQIRGAVAEYERTLITERMRRGRQAKMRHGELLPWSIAPYGYIQDSDAPRDPAHLRIDPIKASVVEQIFAWYTDPVAPASLLGVTARLNAQGIPTATGGQHWNRASVRNILINSTYAGQAHYDPGRDHPGHRRRWALGSWGRKPRISPGEPEPSILIPVPAIISRETFELAQARMERNQQMAQRHNTHYEYLLRGLVSCARCRLACSARTSHLGYNYYACTGRSQPERTQSGERCTAPYVPASALDDLVWQDLCRLILEPALVTRELQRAQAGEWLPQALRDRRRTVQHNLAQIQRRQERLLDAYLAEVISQDELARKRRELQQTQAAYEQQLRQLEAQAHQHLETAHLAVGIEDFCQRLQPTLPQLTFAQRRQLVELLIDRIIVDEHQVEIRYALPTAKDGEKHPFVI
ncbi:MAG TPA: recombinase family protein [Anaerolineae bacterium]